MVLDRHAERRNRGERRVQRNDGKPWFWKSRRGGRRRNADGYPIAPGEAIPAKEVERGERWHAETKCVRVLWGSVA